MSKHHHKGGQSASQVAVNPSAVAKATGATGGQEYSRRNVNEEEIRKQAYQKWVSAGQPDGDGLQFWLEAEQELTRRK